MEKPNLKIRKVKNADASFLYKLLLERSPRASISHKTMPSYKKHVNFVKSKPYSKWYVVLSNNKKIGSVYLTNINEIGISLEKEFDKNQIKEMVLKLLMTENPRKRYLVNISPKNTKSINFFKKKGFNLVQNTYEFLIEGKENEEN
jgi:hypothetical protein